MPFHTNHLVKETSKNAYKNSKAGHVIETTLREFAYNQDGTFNPEGFIRDKVIERFDAVMDSNSSNSTLTPISPDHGGFFAFTGERRKTRAGDFADVLVVAPKYQHLTVEEAIPVALEIHRKYNKKSNEQKAFASVTKERYEELRKKYPETSGSDLKGLLAGELEQVLAGYSDGYPWEDVVVVAHKTEEIHAA